MLYPDFNLQDTSGSGVEIFDSEGSASRVLNIVSSGVDGELYLTYTFEWDHPEIEYGSKEYLEKQKQYQSTASRAIVVTLTAIRKLVSEGEIWMGGKGWLGKLY